MQCGADGTQERFRYCNPPKKGGYPCPSQMQSDSQTCNNGPCPGWYHILMLRSKKIVKSIKFDFVIYFCVLINIVDGGWGDWKEWSECPVSCGGADNTRTRACDNPAPAHGGADCVGDASETGRCNENPCPSRL